MTRLSLALMTADASLLPRPVLSCMFRARWVSRWRSRACSSRRTSLSTSRLSSRTDARSSGWASTSRISRKSCRKAFLRRMCMSLRSWVARPSPTYACKKTVSGWLEHRWAQSRVLSAGLRRGSIHLRIPAIVSFLNPQPALSLVGGNRSSCPGAAIAARTEQRQESGGNDSAGSEARAR
jgi:hypothetical protein